MPSRRKYQVEEVRAGIDWLTMTMPGECDQNDRWYLLCIHQLTVVRDMGYVMTPRRLLGYEGWSAGNCFVGVRNDGVMAQFSGFKADAAFRELYRSDAHISRLDLQVTVRFVDMPHDVARKAYRDATDHNNGLNGARKRKLYIILGSDGGDTCYIGSPSSDQRGRLYNKEVQSEEPSYTRTWRYECVYRNSVATILASDIWSRIGALERTVCAVVDRWYRERGVCPAFDPQGSDIPLPLARTLPTDIETKLRWLNQQVRPTIQYLLELDMLEEVDTALGGIMERYYHARKEQTR